MWSAPLTESLLRRVNMGIAVMGGVLLLGAAGLGLSLLLENTAAGNARLDRIEALEREQTAKGVIAKAKNLRKRIVPVGRINSLSCSAARSPLPAETRT